MLSLWLEEDASMKDATVKSLKQAILDLPADQQQQLAEEILPLLLTTRAGVG
jgi:hypothetical protein